jgi:hypothetical protein
MKTMTQVVAKRGHAWPRLVLAVALLTFAVLATPNAFANCRSVRGAFPQASVAIASAQSQPAASAMAQSAAVTADSKSRGSSSIVGLWYVAFSSQGQVIDQAFEQWHSDGTEILNDTSAPATDNVCLGVWEQTDSHHYKLNHPSWFFDLNGNLLGTVIIKETVRLSNDGRSFFGTSTADAYDTAGNFLGEDSGTVTGKRINP